MTLTGTLPKSVPHVFKVNLVIRLLASILDLYIVLFLIAVTLLIASVYVDIPILELIPKVELAGIISQKHSIPVIQLALEFTLLSYFPAIVYILYSSLFERLPCKASPGKYVLGIEVKDIELYYTTLGQSLRRNIFKFLPWFIIATGTLAALHLSSLSPIVSENLALIFVALVVTSLVVLATNLLMIVINEDHRGMQCLLTDTVVSRKINYSRDNVIFFSLLTIILTFMMTMYAGEFIRYAFHTDPANFFDELFKGPLKETIEITEKNTPSPEVASVKASPSPQKAEEVETARPPAPLTTPEEKNETEKISPPTPEKKFPSLTVTESIQTLTQSDSAQKEGADSLRGDIESIKQVQSEYSRGEIVAPGLKIGLASARAKSDASGGTITISLSQLAPSQGFSAQPIAMVTLHFRTIKSTCAAEDVSSYDVKILVSNDEQQAKYALYHVDTATVSALNKLKLSCSRKGNGWIRLLLKGGSAYLNEGVRGAITWNLYAEAFLK